MPNPYKGLRTVRTDDNQPGDPAWEGQEEKVLESVDSEENHLDVVGSTVAEVLEWVGEDQDRARYALDAEGDNPKPRKSLLSYLDEVLGTEGS